jgi:peroxiredoxin
VASLVGAHLPDMELQAHDGSWVNLARITGTTVLFCYPFTGRPGHPNPPDWDNIPGAHGSTPQILAFSKLYSEFEKFHVKVFGLSFMSTEWQNDFAARNELAYPLLSDENQEFSKALRLETFTAGTTKYLSRRSMIIENGTIHHDMFPVTRPEEDASSILAVLKR